MATRKSWRRAVAPHSPHQRAPAHATRATPRSTNQTAPIPFVGISDDTLSIIMAALLAKDVTLTTTDGLVFNGLFGGTDRSSNNKTLNLCLRYAHIPSSMKLKANNSTVSVYEQRGSTGRRLVVPVAAVSSIRASCPDFSSISLASAQRQGDSVARRNSNFATDSEISRGASGAGRTLQQFEQNSNTTTTKTTSVMPQVVMTNSNTSLDEQTFGSMASSNNLAKTTRKWDQFQVNETKFGVTTTFDEHEYTTKIDRDSADFAKREREATRLASEIEASATDNVHVQEERNQRAADDSRNEEERYGGVQRPQPPRQDARTSSEAPAKPTRLSYAAAAAGGNNRTPSATKSQQHAKNSSSPSTPQLPQKPHAASQPQAQAPKPPANVTKANSEAKPSSDTSAQPAQNKAALPPKPVGQSKTPAKTQANGQATFVQKTNSGKATSSSTKPNTHTNSGSKAASKAATSASKDKDGSDKNEKVVGNKERGGHDNLSTLMKVRSSLTGINSPNQTRNSPLPTPVKANTSAIGVLNLEAETPNLGPERIKKFQEYKTKRELQSIAENREKITDDMKKFSTQLESRNGRRGMGSGSTSAASSSTNVVVPASTEEKRGEEDKNPDDKSPEFNINAEPVSKSTEEVPKMSDASEPGPSSRSADTQKSKGENVALSNTNGANKTEVDKNIDVKPKPKLKSKLNPNAAEFNPDAFKSQIRKPAPPVHVQQPYTSYVPVTTGVDFSQPIPTMAQSGYPMPMQQIPQFPYGQPYAMMVPAAMPTPMPGGGGIQYMQGPAMSFPVGQVPGRFPQSVAMPVSYGYPPVTPMVLAQPGQRMHSGPPYQFYSPPPPFAGPQGGGSPMSPPMQQPVYPQHAGQHGGGMHVQGGSGNGAPPNHNSSGNNSAGGGNGVGSNGNNRDGGGSNGVGLSNNTGGGGGAANSNNSGGGGGGGNYSGGMGVGGRSGGHGGNGRRGGMGRMRGRQHGHHNAQHNGQHHNGPHSNSGQHGGQMGAQGQNMRNANVDRGGPRSPQVGAVGNGSNENGQK